MRIIALFILCFAACAATSGKAAKGAVKKGSFCCERRFAVKLTAYGKPVTILVFAGYLSETGDPHFLCVDSSNIQVLVNEAQDGPFFLKGSATDLRSFYFREGVITVPNEAERESLREYLEQVAWEAGLPDDIPERRPASETEGLSLRE